MVTDLGYDPNQGIGAASAGVGLMPVFQPVVSLPDELIVGYEALARWPMFSTMTATNVFSFANATRQADILDQQCIDAAVRAALDSDLPGDSVLLINTEPTVAHSPRAGHPALDEACERFQVAFELTERHLLSHPKALLEKVAAIRGDGIAIAIDDVGAHPDSLAVLDILDPDIVKLDMTMIQSSAQRDKANTLTGVLAHQERTGALIIAEGVETDEDLEQALAMGAGLAQGFRFGRGHPLGISSVRRACRPRCVSSGAAALRTRRPRMIASRCGWRASTWSRGLSARSWTRHGIRSIIRSCWRRCSGRRSSAAVSASCWVRSRRRRRSWWSSGRTCLPMSAEACAVSTCIPMIRCVRSGSWSCWARIRAGRWWHANSAVPQSMTATGGTNS